MKPNYLITAAFAVGLMVSPESLVLFGHFAGFSGHIFPVAIVCAVIVVLYTAWVYAAALQSPCGKGAEAFAMQTALGRPLALFFPLVSRVFSAVCLSAALAVTAGFAFNEVFVRWVPNFAFAFGLLAVVVLLNLAGRRVAERAQIIFVVVAFAGISMLIMGWVGGQAQTLQPSGEVPPVSAGAMIAVLLLFVGFEFAFFVGADGLRAGQCFKAMALAVSAGGVLFGMWGMASLSSVTREALIDSTIPHMLAARSILGQEGRAIMGIVVIAGACSGVNALLAGVSRMVEGMTQHGLLPSFLSIAAERSLLPVVLIGGGAAVLMGLGFAGEPILEVAIRAGLLFWLLTYGAVHLAALILQGRPGQVHREGGPGCKPVLSTVSMIAFAIAFFWLLVTDERYPETIRFMAMVSAIVVVLCLILTLIGTRPRGAPGAQC